MLTLTRLFWYYLGRPDPSIVEIGKTLASDTVFRPDEVPIDAANKDISTYLEVSLPGLPLDQLHRLTEQTSGLFIYAATVVRMIIPDRRKPPAPSMQKKQLQALLNAWPDKSQRAFGGSFVTAGRRFRVATSPPQSKQNEDFFGKSEFRIYATSESPPPKFFPREIGC
ncbi:hypothetical protein B0H14DRAFT_2606600 [Mycena olivaceomarginata]|nr:hypothetical protein B0H14DRAFT_2606600 [Mycena olivaceomarginata]